MAKKGLKEKELKIPKEYTFDRNTFVKKEKPDQKDLVEVEVGDTKQDDFYPQAKIKRWGNEANFSARLVHEEDSPTVSTEEDRIAWKGDKTEAHFYSIGPTDEYPEGAYEFDVILKERPISNVVEFTIQTKGLDFFYQPPLTEEEIAQGVTRPENVIGSYAVYASEPKKNVVGGKEYRCGKVGHIYRPKIIDARGVEIWGDLGIDKERGILTITVLPRFLRTATYPVRVDPTFGYTSIGGTGYSNTNTEALINSSYRYTAVSGDTITGFSVYSAGGTNTHRMAIYSFVSGVPSTRLGALSSISIGSSGAWYNSSTVSLAPVTGTVYVVANAIQTGIGLTNGRKYDTGPASSGYNRSDFNLPTTFGSGLSNTRIISMYATYISSGGGTAWTKTVTDTITLTDSVKKSPVKIISETVTPTDNLTKTFSGALTLSLADAVSISDNQTKAIRPTKTETVTATDNLTRDVDRVTADTVTATDALSKRPTKSLTDIVGMTDEINLPDITGISDGVTITDSITTTSAYYLTITETITVEDLSDPQRVGLDTTYMVYESGRLKIYVNGTIAQIY